MPFGALTPEQRVRILLELKNAAQYISGMLEASAATAKLAVSERALKRETEAANAQTFAQRQGLYTLRRYAFYATNAFTFAGIAVGALGLQFYNTMQTGSIAFKGFLGSAQEVNKEMSSIYATAATTPFTFPSLVTATRRLLPFTKNIDLTNKLVLSLTNSLSAAGLITDAALTRGSLQLAHMFAVGRLTGQILYNLGRDNIPMQQALQKQFGLTGEAVRREVAGGLITAQMAAQALNKYISQTPGYSEAAVNQATKTLSGAFSTLKDLLGMGVGGAEGGLFGGIQGVIRGVDLALLDKVRNKQKITLTQLMTAFDQVLSPKTHAVINLFNLIYGTLQAVVYEFGALAKSIQLFLQYSGLDKLASLFGGNRIAARLLGYVLGTLITLWIIGRTKALLFAEAENIARLSTLKWGNAVLFTKGAISGLKLLMAGEALTALRDWAFATKVAEVAMNGSYGRTSVFVNSGILAKLTRALFGATAAEGGFASSVWASTVALLANPITLIVAGILALTVGLVVLYIKWKAFHDLVNKTVKFLLDSSNPIAWALRLAFTPLYLAAKALEYIIQNWSKVKSLANNTVGSTTDLVKKVSGQKSSHSIWYDLVHVPGLASGGRVTTAGAVMVGEHGREIVNLPQGASVAPLNNDHLNGTIAVNVYPQDIYMDGQKVGYAISTAYLDSDARH